MCVLAVGYVYDVGFEGLELRRSVPDTRPKFWTLTATPWPVDYKLRTQG